MRFLVADNMRISVRFAYGAQGSDVRIWRTWRRWRDDRGASCAKRQRQRREQEANEREEKMSASRSDWDGDQSAVEPAVLTTIDGMGWLNAAVRSLICDRPRSAAASGRLSRIAAGLGARRCVSRVLDEHRELQMRVPCFYGDRARLTLKTHKPQRLPSPVFC